MKHLYLTIIIFLSLHIAVKSQNTSTQKPSASGASIVSGWIASAKNNVEVLPKDGQNVSAPKASFTSIAPDASSALNELVANYGGILISHGWLRILGAGCKRLNRSLPEWNKSKSFTGDGENPSYVLIADDAVGGFFAINTGGIDHNDINEIFYYGPNGLKWQSTGLNYINFMKFCFSGRITDFYGDFFWKGWQEDVKKLSCDEAISCYPLLWTKEGKELKCNRKTVSVDKIWEQYHHNDVAEVKKHTPSKTEKDRQSTTRNAGKGNPAPSLVYQKH